MDPIGIIIIVLFVIFILVRYLCIPNLFLCKADNFDNENDNENENENDNDNDVDSCLQKGKNSFTEDCLPPYTPINILNSSTIQPSQKFILSAPDYYNLPPPLTSTMESNETEMVMIMDTDYLPPPPSYEICIDNNDKDINITVEPINNIDINSNNSCDNINIIYNNNINNNNNNNNNTENDNNNNH